MYKQISRRRALKTILGSASAAAFMSVGGSAFAQAATQSTAATYAGADRQARLIEGAKKEGNQLNIYTSVPTDDMAVFTGAFEKKYGIKVKLWRSSSENVLQRTVTEGRAGRFEVDIIDTNGPEMESLHREQMLQAVNSPYLADLIKPAILPHGEWVSTRLNVYTQAYNINAVKPADLPKTYTDLLDPKWKGKLGIEADALDWFASVITELGEAKGLKLFRDIVATNGISVRKGHTLLVNLVVSGEVPLALTTYNYKVDQLNKKGAPIQWFAIPPAFARPNGIGMLRRAPHPNAAVLYYDFMLSDAQQIMPKLSYVPTSKKADTPFNKMPLKFIDPKVVLDESEKWRTLYEQIITKQSK
ncbi:MAG TPA: extracellular solute-binding protein [Herbaspirillum sp.]|jgi:iron(III) transport system substrate-binding protein|nr:extracellular solute-binding protein [Herbaspirillum sp.]